MMAEPRTGLLLDETERWVAREPLDGGTVLSDEVGLPGPVRPLMWVVVDEVTCPDVMHILVDSGDHEFAANSAYRWAAQYITFTACVVATTLGDIADARIFPFANSAHPSTS